MRGTDVVQHLYPLLENIWGLLRKVFGKGHRAAVVSQYVHLGLWKAQCLDQGV